MTITRKILRTVEHGQYWLVGGFWMLLGLACIVNIFLGNVWWLVPPWIKIAVGLPYSLVGLGFCLRRGWAMWSMIPLMIAAFLAGSDGWLCGAWCGNRELVRLCLIGLAVIIYSSSFVGLSLIIKFQIFVS